MIANELDGLALDFTVEDFTVTVSKVRGDVYLNFLRFSNKHMQRNFLCLSILFFCWHILSYLLIRLVHMPRTSYLLTYQNKPSAHRSLKV